MKAFIFPGQGSQAVGMGRALAEADRVARDVFEEVDETLGQHLSKIMWEGPAETLTLTENAQPALMAVSMAVARVLEANGAAIAANAHLVAGHSLGEYAAHAAVGSFSLSDAARLLRLRGRAMQNAVPAGEGAMTAILGLDFDTVSGIAARAAEGEVCAAANDNADGQVVVSGHAGAVARAADLAKAEGARRALMLDVSAPFHCALMAPAADAMADALADVEMVAPAVPLVANVTAKPEDNPIVLKKLLIEQVTGAVRWRESMLAMVDAGVTEFIEVGAGKVLAGLVRRVSRDLQAVNLETPDQIDAYLGKV